MKVEILYFEGCPNHIPTVEMVEGVLKQEDIRADIATIDVRDAETVQSLRFIGSPSIRVNGVDIEPGRENDPPFFGCRTYSVSGRTIGVPPEQWLVEALRRRSQKESPDCCAGRGPDEATLRAAGIGKPTS